MNQIISLVHINIISSTFIVFKHEHTRTYYEYGLQQWRVIIQAASVVMILRPLLSFDVSRIRPILHPVNDVLWSDTIGVRPNILLIFR